MGRSHNMCAYSVPLFLAASMLDDAAVISSDLEERTVIFFSSRLQSRCASNGYSAMQEASDIAERCVNFFQCCSSVFVVFLLFAPAFAMHLVRVSRSSCGEFLGIKGTEVRGSAVYIYNVIFIHLLHAQKNNAYF